MSDDLPLNQTDVDTLAAGLASAWWTFALRGIAALAFGAIALFWPSLALTTLTVVFGLYALVDAAAALLALILGYAGSRERWWLALVGLAGATAGLATFAFPQLAALVVIYLIAGWACISGGLQIAGGIALRRQITGELLLMLSGAVSVVFGVAAFLASGAGLPVLTWMVALYAIVYGLILLGVAATLRLHRSA